MTSIINGANLMIKIIPNIHPFFVHFTIALLLFSFLLFLFSFVLPKDWRDKCVIVGRWNLYFGAFITIGTLLAGWQAFNSVIHDEISHLAMKDHRNWALLTGVFFIIMALWAYITRHIKQVSFLFILLFLIGSGLLMITGYKGGELVYRYGVGVMSLPNYDIQIDPQNLEEEHENHAH